MLLLVVEMLLVLLVLLLRVMKLLWRSRVGVKKMRERRVGHDVRLLIIIQLIADRYLILALWPWPYCARALPCLPRFPGHTEALSALSHEFSA